VKKKRRFGINPQTGRPYDNPPITVGWLKFIGGVLQGSRVVFNCPAVGAGSPGFVVIEILADGNCTLQRFTQHPDRLTSTPTFIECHRVSTLYRLKNLGAKYRHKARVESTPAQKDKTRRRPG